MLCVALLGVALPHSDPGGRALLPGIIDGPRGTFIPTWKNGNCRHCTHVGRLAGSQRHIASMSSMASGEAVGISVDSGVRATKARAGTAQSASVIATVASAICARALRGPSIL